jgi:hypothetical protein
VIRQYRWSDSPVSAQSPPSAHWFVLVAKDGVVHLAAAVWMQNGVAHLISNDGREGEIPIDAIDRDATRKRNLEQGLNLRIPAE